jgi:asparagine synthase (glutamine-hydrolysing)
MADVPLGAFLSGGIDSSTVVALMQAQSTQRVQTFTLGFRAAGYDEAPAARAVAAHLGTEHTELYVGPDEARRLIPRIADWFDEPFADSSQIPTYLVAEMTRRHVTVALSGDGGDEVFGGYERYRAHALAARVPLPAAAAGARLLRGLRSARREPRSQPYRARRFLEVAATPASRRYARLVEVFPLELRRRLWSDEARARETSERLPAAADLRLVDIESYLPGDVLPKADIASMAVSLELRSPLLDHRVVELGLALPPALASGKRALVEAFGADLPAETVARRKTGFGVPLDRWFRAELRERAHELVLAGASRGLFRRSELERLLREHGEGSADHGHRLWCLCTLELWQRRYVDAPLAVAPV